MAPHRGPASLRRGLAGLRRGVRLLDGRGGPLPRPILGHALVLRGRSAGGGIVALSCVAALVPAFLTLPLGFYFHWVGVYPFMGLVWIAFLLANVVVGTKALRN